MGCLILVLAILAPRVALVVVFLFTDWLHQAYETVIWPLLGFLFMPYTTLAWMGGELSGGVRGGWALLLVLAIIVDLTHVVGGGRHYHTSRVQDET